MDSSPVSPRGARSALVVAHPGHELRVYGWLTLARPDVYVLTDGSGRSGNSRLHASAALVNEAGVLQGSIFGRLTDRELYDAMREQNVQLFSDLVLELADGLIAGGVTTVAGDAVEGYNPGHDICRLLIDSAVAVAGRRGVRIANYDFAVVGPWTSDAAMTVALGDESLERKVRVARGYEEMRSEVDKSIAELGLESFRVERFRRRSLTASLTPPDLPPFYESHGEKQVEAGHYRDVIRYRTHIAPLNAMVRTIACPDSWPSKAALSEAERGEAESNGPE